jgi:hypothetical protein
VRALLHLREAFGEARRNNKMNSLTFRWLALLTGTCAIFGLSTQAHASPGCSAASGWNGLYPTSASHIINGFEVGDKITMIVNPTSGSPPYGEYEFFGQIGQTLLSYTIAGGRLISYEVTGVDDADLTVTNNGSGTFSISGSACIPAPTPDPPKASDASQALTKGFLLSRINGLLLNSPGAMSLVNRNNSTVQRQRMASAGNAAAGAAAFGTAMGLGGGLGNAMGGNAMPLGASRIDDADQSTIGSNTIQFSQSLSQLRRQASQAQMSKDRMALGAGDGGSLPLAFEATSPWDLWVEAAIRTSTTIAPTSTATATSACSTSAATTASPRMSSSARWCSSTGRRTIAPSSPPRSTATAG